MFLYQMSKLKKILDQEVEVNRIFNSASKTDFECPYDRLIVGSYRLPSQRFIELIKPSQFYVNEDKSHYTHKLVYDRFSVWWGQSNSNAPTTSILINPWKHKLAPNEVLKLINFIVGDYDEAVVMTSDDKLDLVKYLTPKELAERLYIGYQKKDPVNFKSLDQTFYYGRSNGQQVKNYDKAVEQDIENLDWTRLEKTKRYRNRQTRLSVVNFLLDQRKDALEHIVVVDIDKFSGRDIIKKRLKKYGSFMRAYQSLAPNERKKLKRHEAFKQPQIDLVSKFKDDLHKWLSMSPFIYLMFKARPVLESTWIEKEKTGYSNGKLDPLEMSLDFVNYQLSQSTCNYDLRDSYLEGIRMFQE